MCKRDAQRRLIHAWGCSDACKFPRRSRACHACDRRQARAAATGTCPPWSAGDGWPGCSQRLDASSFLPRSREEGEGFTFTRRDLHTCAARAPQVRALSAALLDAAQLNAGFDCVRHLGEVRPLLCWARRRRGWAPTSRRPLIIPDSIASALLQSSKPCARAGRTLQAQVLDMRRHRSMQCRGTCSLALALAILAAVVGGRSDGTPRHSARSRSTQAAAAVPCRSRCRRRPQLFPLRAHCRWRHVMPPQPYLTRAGGWWSAACASCPRSPLQRRRQRGSATPCPAAAPTTPAASTCRPLASSSVPRMPLTARPPWPLPTPTHRRVRGGWTGVITHRGAPLGAAAACPPALC